MKMLSNRILVSLIFCSIFILGCSTGYHYADKEIVGIASFYSSSLDGSRTATGEIFRNNKLTAASNNFPLNTWVKVTNLSNGKSLVVRINDRMSEDMSDDGRVIDLPLIAAQELDFVQKGLVKVRVEKIQSTTPPAAGAVVGSNP